MNLKARKDYRSGKKEYIQKKYREAYSVAKELYVEQMMECPEIAERVRVDYATVLRWRAKGDWDRDRRMHHDVFKGALTSLQSRLDMLGLELNNIKLEDDQFSSKMDGISKLLGQIIKLRNHYEEDKLRMVVKVMGWFGRYVRELGWPDERLDVIEEAMDGFMDRAKVAEKF